MPAAGSQPATANRNNNEPPSFANYLDQSQSPLFSLLPAEIRAILKIRAMPTASKPSMPAPGTMLRGAPAPNYCGHVNASSTRHGLCRSPMQNIPCT
jgi:hypothetical protein